MEQLISLSQARRRWRRILRLVEDGWAFIITRHGKPVCNLTRVCEHAPHREPCVTVTPWPKG